MNEYDDYPAVVGWSILIFLISLAVGIFVGLMWLS